MGEPIRLAVVGGGITGLAAAHALLESARRRGKDVAITVLEASSRFGGNLVSERVDGFLLDAGPDSWVASKGQATALASELGLGSALVGTRPDSRRYYIAWGHALHPVPDGLVLGVPTRLAPLARTKLFTWAGKVRMAFEPFVPARRFGDDDDESIGDFARRRLGRQAAERLVAPLLGGISAGDANVLSVRAAFPQLVAMERDHGSLVRGMLAAQRARAKASVPGAGKPAGAEGRGPDGPAGLRGSAFISLRDGVGSLAEALAGRLRQAGTDLRTGARVVGVQRASGGAGYTIAIEGAEPVVARGVVFAAPAYAAAGATASLDEEVARVLGGVEYASTATVFLAYRSADLARPLDGVGFVVPAALRRPILAATWVSSKWDSRAPDGYALVRAFFGGAAGGHVLERSDAELASLARGELAALMGLSADPLWHRVYRWNRATAQMRVGHLAAMRDLRERLAERAPGFVVAGGGYDGVGIPDCVRQGQEAAERVLSVLG
jgi:oxygen-dependent protoporphyrinogen oxidase